MLGALLVGVLPGRFGGAVFGFVLGATRGLPIWVRPVPGIVVFAVASTFAAILCNLASSHIDRERKGFRAALRRPIRTLIGTAILLAVLAAVTAR